MKLNMKDFSIILIGSFLLNLYITAALTTKYVQAATAETPVINNQPILSLSGIKDIKIKDTYSFVFNTSDSDVGDTLSYTISAGSGPNQTNYNYLLGTISGVIRGSIPVNINLASIPSQELTWNSSTGRYERIVYITASVSDGKETAKGTAQFIVFNNNPTNIKSFINTTSRATKNTFDLTTYFSDPDGHTLTYESSSSSTAVATTIINGSILKVSSQSIGTTNISVTATDGVGGSVTKTFQLKVDNYPPVIDFNKVDKTLATTKDIVTFTGTVTDQEKESVTISGTLGGKTVSTVVPTGNGSWTLPFKASEVDEGIHNTIIVTGTDSSDSVTKTFNFTNLTIDNSLPFFWGVSFSPDTPTSGPIDIRINAGDAFSGVKQVVNPDGSITKKVNSIYRVTHNGDYLFTVEDNVGNTYTYKAMVNNIDRTKAEFRALTLHKKSDNMYQATVRAMDDSGINRVELDNGLTFSSTSIKDSYKIDNLEVKPNYIKIIDNAGNDSGPIYFLNEPTINFNSNYSSSKTIKEDVTGEIRGDNSLSYYIGLKEYECTKNPCKILITKSTDITAINATSDKATIRTLTVDNINKSKTNLVLKGLRDNTNPNKITFSWNLATTDPKIICNAQSGEHVIIPTGNPHLFIGENQTYYCSLEGLVGGVFAKSNVFTIHPDYKKDVVFYSQVDKFTKKAASKNTYVERNVIGHTYYINFSKNNTDKVPIPHALIK